MNVSRRSDHGKQVQSHAPKGVITLELGQATVLPGLTDCHSHLLVRPTITERSGCITGKAQAGSG